VISRFRLLFWLVPVALVACAEAKQAWKDVSTGTKRAFRTIGKTCPEGVPGRAVGTPDSDGALGCFQKAVGEEDPKLLLRIVCHGRTPADCKHGATADKEATAGVKQFAKNEWRDVLGSWSESDNVTVYAIDNLEKTSVVSTVTTCRIAEPPPTGDAGASSGKVAADDLGWAVCDVDRMPREAARKKSDS
jgi:hypothetical protein